VEIEIIEFLLNNFQFFLFWNFFSWSLGLFLCLFSFGLFLAFLGQFFRLLFEFRLDGLDLFRSL